MMENTVTDERIATIRRQVVGMYSKVPWPGNRRADEEMGWRLRSLGVRPDDYAGKKVLEVGCGTGDYALWYATHGAQLRIPGKSTSHSDSRHPAIPGKASRDRSEATLE